MNKGYTCHEEELTKAYLSYNEMLLYMNNYRYFYDELGLVEKIVTKIMCGYYSKCVLIDEVVAYNCLTETTYEQDLKFIKTMRRVQKLL